MKKIVIGYEWLSITTLSLVFASLTMNAQETEVSDQVVKGSLSQYLEKLQKHPQAFGSYGSWKKGEIEVIVSPEQIKKIENQTKQRLKARGCTDEEAIEWSTVGIVAEDNCWMWVRDAVIFPSGVYGTYDRLIRKSSLSGPAGVGVLPILSNKKLVVNLTYRHATRSWEFELPRAQRKEEESIEQTARRGLLEETGYFLEKDTYLGTVAPDSGLSTSVIPIYAAKVSHSGNQKKSFSRAIQENPSFSYQQLKEGFSKGYIEYPINGQIEKVSCRDTFLAYALFQAEIKGLLQ